MSMAVVALLLSAVNVAAQNPCNTPGTVVSTSGLSFSPQDLTIEAGETVVWVNTGGFHDVNFSASASGATWNNPETFALPAVTGDASGVCIGSHTFTVPGVYNYDCSVGTHALSGMVGTVTVTSPPPPSNTVVDIIVNSADHTTLETAVIAADLVETLNGAGPFTVFAPTDAAFDALPEGTLDAVLADIDLLTAILTYHVVGGTTLSTDLMDGMSVETLNGESVDVTINMDGVFINNAEVIVADLAADNGVVHVIDAVLLPPTPPSNTVVDIIVNSADHTTLETAVIAADLVETLNGAGPFTVFAPTDAAFDALPDGTLDAVLADIDLLTAILTYHVVGGTTLSTDLMDGMSVETLNGESVDVTINMDGVFINDAEVIVADLAADNGVVHVIDAVLLPPTPPSNTVVDIIVNSADHTTLETAVIAADLVETLNGAGPFTVFAPTDAAFDALPDGTLDAVLADIDLLTAILTYHVVGGTTLSTDLMDGMSVETLNGESVNVTINADGVFINDAEVIVADLVADNGVVHVIDAVLLPPTPETNTVVDIIVNSEDHTILETAVIAADLVETLSGAGPFTVFAPTDAAFDALPDGTLDAVLADIDLLTAILTYHVVGGTTLSTDLMDGMSVETLNGESVDVTINMDGVFINDAEVIVADLVADNGVVHVIDAVLLPPTPETNTVVDIIVNSEDHTILETAVIAADLVETLSGAGPFTVFAPTDAAFDALPDGTLDAVLADIDLLTAILTYHVVGGTTLSTDLMDGMSVETLNGESVNVTINADGVFINDAEVIVADLVADNGVVHVIDAVLLPPTSVPSLTAAQWSVYPNPTDTWLQVAEWPVASEDVMLVNTLGQTVAQWSHQAPAFDASQLKPGIYFIGAPAAGWKQVVIR